jgi:hypothetical protein
LGEDVVRGGFREEDEEEEEEEEHEGHEVSKHRPGLSPARPLQVFGASGSGVWVSPHSVERRMQECNEL